MIIKCNTCGKSFSVPDNAISAKGRLVQCGSCGNKWTQYPIQQKKENKIKPVQINTERVVKPIKKKKKAKKNKASINLYSAEYLQKKHGIKIIDPSKSVNHPKVNKTHKIGYGFYNYLITFMIFTIMIFGILNLNRDLIYTISPEISSYVEHLFETVENIKKIISDMISSY